MADSLEVLGLRTGNLDENCYIVSNTNTRECVVIDPGDSADYIIQNILSNDYTPVAILATHGHYDHIMAVFELKLAYSIPFYMHKEDEFLLHRLKRTVLHFEGFDPGPPPAIDIYLENNSALKIAGADIHVIHTPGHTPGSVCFYLKNKSALFTGDLLFDRGRYGETSHNYSDKHKILRSIAVINKLPGRTIVHPGHGDTFLLSTKKRSNG